MNNLTAREKGFMYVITLLIIVVLAYFFGIRTLNKKYEEYKVELKTLQDRKAYLDQLRENNASMASEIEILKSSCVDLELSFIDKLETDCIEQYLLKTFETAGCPFLVSVTAADTGMSPVTYPDGTPANESLSCLQIEVVYSSTDGYTVTQYNRTPDQTRGSKTNVAETIADLAEKMGQGEYAKRRGYNEFLTALKKINSDNPDCIKVSNIKVEESNGALTLTASIDFYGVNLVNRLSVDERTDAYTFWTGHKNVDTKGGFVGFPYICDNKNSLWYGITNDEIDPNLGKPFAPYWASALFALQYAEVDGDLKTLTNFEGETTPTPTPTPAAT